MLFCRRILFSPVRRHPLRILHHYHARVQHPRPLSLEPEKAQVPEVASQLEHYSTHRRHDHCISQHFTFDTLSSLWRLALARQYHAVLEYLSQDVVERFHGPSDEQARLILSVLRDVSKARIPRQDVLKCLEKLSELDQLDSLPPKTVQNIIQLVDAHPRPEDRTLLAILVPNVIQHLNRFVAPVGQVALTYRPSWFVRTCFRLIRRLVTLDEQSSVLELFQVLVKTRNVPQQVVSGVDASHKDFGYLIRSALIRAATHWDWRDVAGDLLRDMVKTEDLAPQAASGILDCLYGLLESPTPADVDTCSDIIRALDAGGVLLPDGLCRQFYLAAHKLDKGDTAMAIFAFMVRAEAREDRPVVPLPPGPSLTWFLAHLVRRRKEHLGRILVRQVSQTETGIPVQDRARFIQLACSSSYGQDARILYERYSVGRDRDVVRGDARVVVRMVSLFSKLIKQSQGQLDELESEGPVQDPQRQLLRHRIDDFKRFMDGVLAEYRQVHEPLERAEHFSLTSLARCLIIVGEFKEALDVLKIVLLRRELPDVHDINVALTALAEYNPNTAMQLVEYMCRKGIRPDSVTFGTLIHHGVLHGHPNMVKRALSLARSHGETISNKAVVLLIRASVAADLKSGQVKEHLTRALDVLRTLEKQDLQRPDLSGKYLVYASLRAHEPELAFRFWKLLLKEQAESEDHEQVYIRRLVARMIRKHVRLGWMTADVGRMMIYELGEQRRRVR